jgi:hypothetical protein
MRQWLLDVDKDRDGMIGDIPIDEKHRFTEPIDPADRWILDSWVQWFTWKRAPHAVVTLASGKQLIFKHLYSNGKFCCGASN